MKSTPVRLQSILAAIEDASAPSLSGLWTERSAWKDHKQIYLAVGRRWLSLGEPLLAYDSLSEGTTLWPDDDQLAIAMGLALARCGAYHSANQLLSKLYSSGNRSTEAIGILARTYKDLWTNAGGSASGQHFLSRCAELYLEAYLASGDLWTGINAASTALFLEDHSCAVDLAREVRDACLEVLNRSSGSATDYWLYATLGEASLILDDIEHAQNYYALAVRHGAGAHGNIATTRRNAKLIARYKGIEPKQLDAWLPVVQIAIFTGHMIDANDRSQTAPRFPIENERAVAAAIEKYIQETGVMIGFSSAARGADLLFLEAVLNAGGEIHIVLPQTSERFARAGFALPTDGDWRVRYQRVLERANTVTVASEDLSSDISYAYANVLIFGMASAKAHQLDGELHALAVWDGAPGPTGGTASAVECWTAAGLNIHVVSPLSLKTHVQFGATQPRGAMCAIPQATGARLPRTEGRIVSILFADVAGFSKLSDEQVPAFVEFFLGTVASFMEAHAEKPLVRNTWGDGLYFAFADPGVAGAFALGLRDRVNQIDWPAHGLPADLHMRVALHCGPAFAVFDPVIQQATFIGSHVTRAARIEPVTPPGEVYASASFVAVSEAMRVGRFAFSYVGQMPLAKKFGTFPIYRLQWSASVG